MATRKTAIAVPEKVLAEIDRAAAALGQSRSKFITDALRRIVSARSDAEITRRINEVYGDPRLVRESRTEAAQLATAATKWRRERW